MSTEEIDTTPSNEAELADQGFSESDLGGQGYSAAGEVSLIKARRTFLENVWRGLKSAPPTALFGLTVITIYIFFALFAPLLAPYGEAEIFDLSYAPWSDEFMFGTDQLGRDILSRLIYGARNTVGIAFVTTMLA
ncbi:MAG: ABC transporter permease, partial [Gammaproteobacteria bacterium]